EKKFQKKNFKKRVKGPKLLLLDLTCWSPVPCERPTDALLLLGSGMSLHFYPRGAYRGKDHIPPRSLALFPHLPPEGCYLPPECCLPLRSALSLLGHPRRADRRGEDHILARCTVVFPYLTVPPEGCRPASAAAEASAAAAES